MTFRKLFASALVLAATAAISGSSALAAPWVPPAGATNTFTYSGGMDDNGLFGSPVSVTDSGFSFKPTNFIAVSSGGAPGVKTDRLEVKIDAKPNTLGILGVNIGESGDYSILGGGTISEFAYLGVLVLDPGYGPQTLFTVDTTQGPNGSTTPGMPVSTGGNAAGTWTANLSITLPSPAKSIVLVLNDILQATSTANGSAVIQKKFVGNGNTPGIDIIIPDVPEPTTLTVVAAGASMILRRRRSA